MSIQNLTSVPPVIGRSTFDNRFEVASQVLAAGTQDVAVRVLPPLSGPHQGQIGVRVGRVLIYCANREALSPSSTPGRRPPGWPTRPSVLSSHLDSTPHFQGPVIPTGPSACQGKEPDHAGNLYRRTRADGAAGRWHAVIDLPRAPTGSAARRPPPTTPSAKPKPG